MALGDSFLMIEFWHSSPRLSDAVKHFVAKLVKSFGRLGDSAESLDDFRYQREVGHNLRKLDEIEFFLLDCPAILCF